MTFKAFIKANPDNTYIQFLRYIVVGGISFVADAGTLWILEHWLDYLIAAAVAFIVGLIVNFVLSKLFVFQSKKNNSVLEFAVYAVIGVVGLGLTELLMYVFTDKMGLYFIISKIITAAIVLVWNFVARKVILYRRP